MKRLVDEHGCTAARLLHNYFHNNYGTNNNDFTALLVKAILSEFIKGQLVV